MVQQFKQRSNKVLNGYFPTALTEQTEQDSSILINQYAPYQNNKIKLNSYLYYESLLTSQHQKLKSNVQFKLSCGEHELLPFVQIALNQTELQMSHLEQVKSKQLALSKKNSSQTGSTNNSNNNQNTLHKQNSSS